MRRLTNNQMDILALSALDKLEELHNIKVQNIQESEEYKNFEQLCDDPVVADLKLELQLLREITDKIKSLEIQVDTRIEVLREKYPDFHFSTYNKLASLENAINHQLRKLKEKKFSMPSFDRDKLLTKIKAEVILSSIADPNELIKEVTDKFKN